MAVGVRRRRRRPAWLMLAVMLSLLVVGLNAAISARSTEPTRTLEDLAYVDQVRPLIQRSNEQGEDLEDVRQEAAALGRAGISRRMERLAREARTVAAAVRRLEPPQRLSSNHAVLVATAVIRERAAASMRQGLSDALGTAPPDSAVDELVTAGDELNAADRTYAVFVSGLPRVDGSSPLPPSKWLAEPGVWAKPEVTAFVTTLRSSESLAPVHDVSLILFTTDPAAVGNEGGAVVLPPLKSLHVDVVVANVGNEAERRVTVVVGMLAPDGTIDTAREFVDLVPGQRQTVGLGLRPPKGASALTVKVEPVAGELAHADNEKLVPVIIR